MARELVFKLNNQEHSFLPSKVDRKKIYGWTDVITFDDDGNECKLVSMDEAGTVIIPKGGLAMGCISNDFMWVEKSELKVVDTKGNEIQPFPSSFSGVIELNTTVTIEEFLDYCITNVYILDGAENNQEFVSKVKENIYTFPFNYREGFEESPAFIIENEGKVFFLVGVNTEFDYIGLDETGFIEEVEEEEEDEDIDFSMM